MNLINEISAWESELESLRSENKILRETKIILDFENDQLKRRVSQLEEKCDYVLSEKVHLKTMLDQTGQSLVSMMGRHNEKFRGSLVQDDTQLIAGAAE